VDPVLPVGPVTPVDPVLPVGPVTPVDPVLPVGPVTPVDPVLPVGTGGKVGPTRSGDNLKLECIDLFIFKFSSFPSTTPTTFNSKIQLQNMLHIK
ncbi:hypothetical protein AB1I94_18805, partial [Bacillus paranthracis]